MHLHSFRARPRSPSKKNSKPKKKVKKKANSKKAPAKRPKKNSKKANSAPAKSRKSAKKKPPNAERRPLAPAPPAPEECILRSAHGQAVASDKGDKLKLTIGYTTYEPAAASLTIGHLGTVHRHLGRSGVLRLVEDLHGHDSPKHLSVQIDIPSAKSARCPFRRLALSPR